MSKVTELPVVCISCKKTITGVEFVIPWSKSDVFPLSNMVCSICDICFKRYKKWECKSACEFSERPEEDES